MLRFVETKLAKEKFYGAKKQMKVWDVDVNNISISKLLEKKDNSKYLIRFLDKVIKSLLLILPKISGYAKKIKVKGGNKDKDNSLMSFCIDDDKLLEKNKTIWTKIENLKNIELTALPEYDDRYIKPKIRTYGDKVYFNLRSLNVPQRCAECESFIIISINSLVVYENKYTCKYI